MPLRARSETPAPPAKRPKRDELEKVKQLQVDRVTNEDARGMGPRRVRNCTLMPACCITLSWRPSNTSKWGQTGERVPDRIRFWTAARGLYRQSGAGSWRTLPSLVRLRLMPTRVLHSICLQTKHFQRQSGGFLHKWSGCRFGVRFSGSFVLCLAIFAFLLGAGTPALSPIIVGMCGQAVCSWE